MSNRFAAFSAVDNDSDSSSSSSSDEGDSKEPTCPRRSALRLRLKGAEAELQKSCGHRDQGRVEHALQLFHFIRLECSLADSGTVIRCHAHSGTGHMLLAMFNCKTEHFAETLLRYEAAIAEMETAMELCQSSTDYVESPETIDSARLERDRARAADAIKMDLEQVTQLRDELDRAELRKQAAIVCSYSERDAVKLAMGESQWKAQRGTSLYTDKRKELNRALRDIRRVLRKIDETEHQRERLKQVGQQRMRKGGAGKGAGGGEGKKGEKKKKQTKRRQRHYVVKNGSNSTDSHATSAQQPAGGSELTAQ